MRPLLSTTILVTGYGTWTNSLINACHKVKVKGRQRMSPRPCRVQASTTSQSRKAGKVQRIENLEGKSTASGEKFVNSRYTSKVSKSSKGEVRKRLFSSDCYPFELPKSLTIIAGILEWLVCYS